MKRFADFKHLLSLGRRPRVVTIGNFDGVHTGHRAVISAARAKADACGLELAVLTFDPHPADLLEPDQPRMRLVTLDRKAELLAACDVDLLLVQKFDEAFSGLSAEQFASRVLGEALGAQTVFVGRNFRFGRGREAGIEELKAFGKRCGFTVAGQDLVEKRGEHISSSRIRALLVAGDVKTAAQLLGRPHELPGRVAHGHKKGRELGFPTANLEDIHVLCPGPGIYAARCRVGDELYDAAVYVGNRPTLGHGFAVEAHLINSSRDLYGQRAVLYFLDRIRGELKFASEAKLVTQIRSDVEKARRLLEEERG